MESKILKRKITSIYSIAVGSITIMIWTSLLFLNKIPSFNSKIISFIFQWFSEFIGGVLLLMAGIAIAKRLPMRKALLFIALGFHLNSIFNLFIYYTINFEFTIFIISTLFLISTVFIAGWNYSNWSNIVFLALALSLYCSINLLGDTIAKAAYIEIFKITPILIFSMLAMILFYNRTLYKETIEKQNK